MIDSSDSDKEILTNAASGFAVGMGGMEATCGALIGATMMAGIVKPGKKSAITAREILMILRVMMLISSSADIWLI